MQVNLTEKIIKEIKKKTKTKILKITKQIMCIQNSHCYANIKRK